MDKYLHSDIKNGERFLWACLWVVCLVLGTISCAISCNKFWEKDPCH